MKKYLHIALMLLCVFVVSSCKDDDDDTEAVEREAYKLEQDIAFQAKVNETGFVRWYSEAGDGYVCAKLVPSYLVGQLLCNIWLKEINMRFGFRSS